MLGKDDKRQITAVIAASMMNELLPTQLIFKGKTKVSIPKSTDASTKLWHLTSSSNHWSNLDTMKDYFSYILEPYRQNMVNKYNIAADSKMIIILDAWSVHRS